MNGPTVTYLIMFTIIVILTTCVIYLSKRSDDFEDDADTNYLAWFEVNERLVVVTERNHLLETCLDMKFADLFRTDTPKPDPAQPTLFGHDGIGYLEYTD